MFAHSPVFWFYASPPAAFVPIPQAIDIIYCQDMECSQHTEL